MALPDDDQELASLGAQLEKRAEFERACKQLAKLGSSSSSSPAALLPLAKRAHTILRARHTNPGPWRAGLELFDALGSAAPSAWSRDARSMLGDEGDDGGEGGGAGAGAAATTLADVLSGPQAAAELRRARAAAIPVMTDAGMIEPPPPPPPTRRREDGGQGEAEDEGDNVGERLRQLFGGGGYGGGEDHDAQDDDDLAAALLASRLEAANDPSAAAPARPPASRRALAALPKRTVEAAAAPSAASSSSSSSSSSSCAICQFAFAPGDVVQALLPGCGHEFHEPCLAAWLGKHSNQCPVCRSEMPTDDHRYEAKREREREEAEEKRGAENAARGGEFLYV
jgi:E3 ubiquitin-protein ligase AIP2